MKNKYMVKKINLNHVKNVTEYWEAVNKATPVFCDGLEAVREYCEGRLHYNRNGKGYSGINGNIEYVAMRV